MITYLASTFTEAKLKPVQENLTQLGYTSIKGSPSKFMIKIGSRWHRIYVLCFSNSASCFVRLKHGKRFLTPDQWDKANDLANKRWAEEMSVETICNQ